MANVLIVEDNADNLKLATFLLQSAGHTVISASNAEAGLALARSDHPQLADKVSRDDIVVLIEIVE